MTIVTIRAYTTIELSRKLAQILPLESANMFYFNEVPHLGYKKDDQDWLDETKNEYIPCWSLAALIDIMPKDKSIECSISFGYYNGKGEYIEKWLCAFEKEGETTDDYIIETFDGNNPVDACVAMIEKLHKLKML